MHKWLVFFSLILLIGVIGVTYFTKSNTLPVVGYFPLDDQSRFTSAESDLKIGSDQAVTWISHSASDKSMYLRQDVSLLFENGKLRGARSKWKQDTKQIKLKESLSVRESSLFQAVSFHHGEIHLSDDDIKSIQYMSAADLYVVDTAKTSLIAFNSPEDPEETEWKNLLDKTTQQQLRYHWQQLFSYFDIDSSSYLTVPLTHLYKYEEEPLPSMSQAETDQVMGQLWEGLYKNYIIPAVSMKNQQDSSYIPIVLFDKQQKHLLVLFEINGKKQQLIQKYTN